MRSKRFLRFVLALMMLVLLTSVVSADGGIVLPVKPKPNVMRWRSGITENFAAPAGGDEFRPGGKQPAGHNILVNQDYTFRAQNETAIAANPANPQHLVVGYNDYSLGWPIGGGVGVTFDGGKTWKTGSVVFPALTSMEGIVEPPVGTGDPVVAIARDGTVYHTSIGFSATWCMSGVFLYRSDNGGLSYWRPGVASGTGLVDYWPYATDCSVFLDKEWMTVDNSGGPHDGRVYVTYTRFVFDGPNYVSSAIHMAYSDDKGRSFTQVGEINGSSAELCEFQSDLSTGESNCDEDQFSVPVVGKDGSLYVHYVNSQNASEWTSPWNFNSQVMVVKINPDTFEVSGPYKVATLYDGAENYPFNADGRQTVCNGGWRLNAYGNLAIGPNDELYVTFADNRNGDLFPYPTFLNPDGSCPDGLQTSTDVFVSKSTDGGMTWSEPLKISSDPQYSDNWFPWLAVGENGWVWNVYYDRRVSGNNTLTDAWIALSKDGGLTWKEQRVSETSSNFRTAFFGTPSFIGDYNGLAVVGQKAYPFWTGALVPGDSDVYTQVVNAGTK